MRSHSGYSQYTDIQNIPNAGIGRDRRIIYQTRLANFNAARFGQNKGTNDNRHWVLNFLEGSLNSAKNNGSRLARPLEILLENKDLLDDDCIEELFLEGKITINSIVMETISRVWKNMYSIRLI